MNSPTSDDSKVMAALFTRAAAGEKSATAHLLEMHRERLRRMVEIRLDRRLRARVDASDVLQDVSLEATRRLPRYLEERPMPLFLWLRFLTGQRLAKLHRDHLRTGRRDPRREASHVPWFAPSSVDCLAASLAAGGESPSQAAAHEEQRRLVERGLEQLDPQDREIISLRHYEQLSNVEVARELGLETSAASKRYLRAIRRLREILDGGSTHGGATP